MPRYVFECQECSNLRFERTLKMGEHPVHACPSCGEDAPRVLAGEGFGFAFQSGGSAPANSGVHDLDYPSADKVVGRSAHDRWQTYTERHEVKKKVRAGGGVSQLARVDGEGYSEYASMSAKQKQAREKLVDLAVKVGARKGDQ